MCPENRVRYREYRPEEIGANISSKPRAGRENPDNQAVYRQFLTTSPGRPRGIPSRLTPEILPLLSVQIGKQPDATVNDLRERPNYNVLILLTAAVPHSRLSPQHSAVLARFGLSQV